MTEQVIVDAVERWFRREYGAGFFCGECVVRGGGRADLVYVARGDSIHVVEAKARADSVSAAFSQLARYPANYRWVALPEDDYEDYGAGVASACAERGFGLFLVGGGPNHRIVTVRRAPVYVQGRFDHRWGFSD